MNDNYQPLTTEHMMFLSGLAVFLFICYVLRNVKFFSRVNYFLLHVLLFIIVAAVAGNIKDFFNDKK
jgi:hypothetical protein